MKKWISFALTMVMVVSLTACGSSQTKEEQVSSLYEQGLDMVSKMAEMAQSEEYINLYTDSPQVAEVVQEIGEDDFSELEAVYSISIPKESLVALLELGELEDVPTELSDVVMDKLLGSWITYMNGMSGTLQIVASSVCSMEKTFVNKEVTESVIYIYTFEDATPIGITFLVGEDSAISAKGFFIMNEAFTAESVEELAAFLGDEKIEIKEVNKD
ncbi:MAG: hypothetical protein IJO85_03630 [Lachnospiraceae bacterium]|nr:hypothetical protein [Lachnospiraceae bacterium]